MYTIRACECKDVPAVDRFMNSVVLNEEPLISANGPVAVPPISEGLSAHIIPQGHSVMAVDSLGQVIGVFLNDEPPQPFTYIYTNTVDDIKELFQYIEERSNVTTIAPDALEVRLMAVDPAWRKKGLATGLMKASEKAAKTGGFNWLKTYCTNHYTNNVVTKLGWTLIYSLSYEEYINNIEPSIRQPSKPHTHCNLYIKRIV